MALTLVSDSSHWGMECTLPESGDDKQGCFVFGFFFFFFSKHSKNPFLLSECFLSPSAAVWELESLMQNAGPMCQVQDKS